MVNMENYNYCIERIINGLGIKEDNSCIKGDSFVSNAIESKSYLIHGTSVKAHFVIFDSNIVRVDIGFALPSDAVLADTFMDYCAGKEGTKKNHSNEYCYGPTYKDWGTELGKKQTFACSPWHNRYFYIRSEHYPLEEVEDAVNNALALAKQFFDHLGEVSSLRFWTIEDEEVKQKAKEIIANADLREDDIDRETNARWLADRNSFFKGWFYPNYNNGKGTFDTFLYGTDFVAKNMGNEGSFEYAVACILLEDEDFIRKAKKVCRDWR